jgi:hypothetical protein
MLECYPSIACLGGPSNECELGYTGEACSECAYGYYRLSHYCAACAHPELTNYMIPGQLFVFTVAVLALTLGFDTFSRFATLSIFVRFVQVQKHV